MNTTPPQQVHMDDIPLNTFHIKIAGLTFGAHLTDGYVLGVIGFALTQLKTEMALTPFWQGMIGSSALIGLFLGSLLLGWISDYVGRQKIFTFSFVIITLASALQFFADTPEQLFWLRVLVGIGLGGDYAVGHTMLAEFSPRKQRGILLGSFSVIWTFGYVAAGFVSHYMLADFGCDAWRWLLASSAIPALLIMLLRIGTPESPRWLMRKGRISEAYQVVRRHFGPHVVLNDEIPVNTARHLYTLFSARYWRRTAFNSLFFVCLVIPYFAIYTFLPSILNTLKLDQNFATDLLLNGLLVLGALLGIACTQWLPRRRFLIGAFWLLAFSLGTLAFVPSGELLMLLLFALFTLTISAVSNLVGVFPAESFPTDIRSLGVGFATAMSRLGSAIGTGLLPLALVNLGLQNTMLILTAVLVFGALVSMLWAPETKGLTLVNASVVKAGSKES
ncbi:MFS transporter [Serratia microhaemolytica]|uniref:MFS transporter n=1 Tax=Serratia microhaemolytica TaxID=2675110 RepID=UPI000FDCFD18|nr:MFS transporter [Serratia microhaemolytica]